MPGFGYVDFFSSDRPAQECLQAARESLSSLGCRKVAAQDAMEVTGKVGMGWVVRLIGGVLAPATWVPVSLFVGVRDLGDRREITVRADENFCIGSLLGVGQKMRARCDDLGNQIGRLLRSRLV